MSEQFRPRLIAFVCNWCSYAGADNAGGQKLTYPADIKLVRVMCSGRVDPQFVLDAFNQGADGVMVLGSHPGDCHYRCGNMKAMRRFRILEKLLPKLGIDPRRFRLDWVAAAEGSRFQKVVTEMVEAVAALGPLQLEGHVHAVTS